MKIARIVIGKRPSPLVRLAADEMVRYLNVLSGTRPRVVATPGRGAGHALSLRVNHDTLSEQGYAFRRIDPRTHMVEGGSPIAVLWGVYDLVERWGVRYELHGDILPDRPGSLQMPAPDTVCEPTLKLRCFRTYNDFANNECAWPAEDYRVLIDQLTKLRFNAIMLCTRPADPFVDLRFHGARKSIAAPNFGWQPRIRPGHPGFDQFVASGDAQREVFVNPDLTGHGSYAKTIAAGQAYARKIFRMAHARGMKCIVVAQVADFDPAIRRKMLEMTKPRHKAKPYPIVRIRMGVYQEGPDVETGRCMSVNNPVFLDAIATNMQAHIDAFPDADAFFFSSTEFGGSGADCDRAWKALDRKYGFSNIKSLKAIEREARAHAEDDPDRSQGELRSDIVILYALDKLINERGLDMSRARRGATVAPGALAAELHRFLPLMLPHGSMFFASYGYMPGHVATRTDTLRLEDPESVRFILTISAEDDNVGLLPQATGPAVHKLINALRQSGAAGFLTRQWQHSNLLPTFHYMGHAAWEKGWTPDRAYRHLVEPICGRSAVVHYVRAMKRIERVTTHLHENTICISFAVPNWISNYWQNWPKSHDPDFLQRTAKVYASASDDLNRAMRASRPAGRDMLYALECHTRHAYYYCAALAELGRARAAEDVCEQVTSQDDKRFPADTWPGGRFDRLDTARQAVRTHAVKAESLMRQACEVFAEGVRDRNDLGALATLNNYNLDVVAAIAEMAHAAAEMLCCRDV